MKVRSKLISLLSAAIITSSFLTNTMVADAQNVDAVLESREPTYDWYIEFTEAMSVLPEEYKPCTLSSYFSDDDIDLFYRVVAAEIGSDYYTFEQRVNVASVILHRWIKSGASGLGKVLVASQFSTISNGRIYKVDVTDEIRAACQYAMWFDGDYDGAMFFNNSRTWDGVYKYLGYDGAHYFYR